MARRYGVGGFGRTIQATQHVGAGGVEQVPLIGAGDGIEQVESRLGP